MEDDRYEEGITEEESKRTELTDFDTQTIDSSDDNCLINRQVPRVYTFSNTMAQPNNNNNHDLPEDPVQPVPEWYSRGPGRGLTPMQLPYVSQPIGLGITLESHQVQEVYANDRGDRCQLNETGNVYAKMMLGWIMDNLHEGRLAAANQNNRVAGRNNRQSERTACDDAFRAEYDRLMDAQLIDNEDEPLTVRRLNLIWNVMTGFNSAGAVNPVLTNILKRFAKIRLGATRHNVDEFGAAVCAIQEYYLEVTSDNRNTGRGAWTFPIVHLLNGSLIHRGMTPISFSNDEAVERTVAAPQRLLHCREIWVGGEQGQVETRQAVIEELNNFSTANGGDDLLPIPADEGRPDDDNAGQQRRNVRRRFSAILN